MRVIASQAGASKQSAGLESGAVGIDVGREAGEASGARGGLHDGAADDQIGFAEADEVADDHPELIKECGFEEKYRSGRPAQGGPSPCWLGFDVAVERKLSASRRSCTSRASPDGKVIMVVKFVS